MSLSFQLSRYYVPSGLTDQSEAALHLQALWGGTSHQALWSLIGHCTLSPWHASHSIASVDMTTLVTASGVVFVLLLLPPGDASLWWGTSRQLHALVCRSNSWTPEATWTSWSHWATQRRYSTYLSLKWGVAVPSCQSWIMWVNLLSENIYENKFMWIWRQ